MKISTPTEVVTHFRREEIREQAGGRGVAVSEFLVVGKKVLTFGKDYVIHGA